jgi:hypothetical protein
MDPSRRSAIIHIGPGETAAPHTGMSTDSARNAPSAFFDSVIYRIAPIP